jgi:ComF family protein
MLRSAILAVKYARQRRLGSALGQLLAVQPWVSGDAVIVPIPGSSQRIAQRGYDQAVVLAQAVATTRHLPLSQQLVRVRQTTAQAKLNRGQRQQNVAGAFMWQGGVPPTQIVLIDDICTTGATIAAAIAAIHHAGPCQVHVVVLARGVK